MLKPRGALIVAVLLAAGCRSPQLPSIDQTINNYASRPYDVAPTAVVRPATPPPPPATPPAAAADGAAADAATLPGGGHLQLRPAEIIPLPQVERSETGQAAIGRPPIVLVSAQVVEEQKPGRPAGLPPERFDLRIPAAIPGSETPKIALPPPEAAAGRRRAIAKLYPQLPPLAEEPLPQLSAAGRAYSLDDLQRLAAANSPTLREAAADVESARGRLQQARTYQNPVSGFGVQPNANNTGSTTYGTWIDQTITTAGKMKLNVAMAQVNFSNAELALRRARSDLATQVRTAYYSLVVARETVRINRVLAHFTDDIFRLQTELLAVGQVASHEPAALRSQVFVVRLAHRQAITNYAYAWKQLVAAMGLPQMPLSAVEGQVDRFIPYYEYDDVLAYVLRNHTDILTARNDIVQTDYNLKLAQVTPIPNVDVIGSVWQENQVLPKMEYHQMSVSMQVPIWDQNKGNIRAAAAARARAIEEPHQAELALTNGLATAYGAYQDNLAAVEYYRQHILPDQVRYYRGVFERRQIDPNAAFNDLVTAQQNLVADVGAYLGILGQLWTSVINVADFLQTDDFYQLAKPMELPPLPEFDAPHCWPCPHPQGTGVYFAPGQVMSSSAAAGNAAQTAAVTARPATPASAVLPTLAERPAQNVVQGAGVAARKPTAVEPIAFVSPPPASGAMTQQSASPIGPLVSNSLPPASGVAQAIAPPGAMSVPTAAAAAR